jgi:hypothetical protein
VLINIKNPARDTRTSLIFWAFVLGICCLLLYAVLSDDEKSPEGMVVLLLPEETLVETAEQSDTGFQVHQKSSEDGMDRYTLSLPPGKQRLRITPANSETTVVTVHVKDLKTPAFYQWQEGMLKELRLDAP